MTTEDILARLHIKRGTFWIWRKTRGFPPPKDTLSRIKKLWDRRDVEEWIRRTNAEQLRRNRQKKSKQ